MRRGVALLAAGLGLVACVATPVGEAKPESPGFAHSLFIPLNTGMPVSDTPLTQLYERLLESMAHAHADRDLAQLRALLNTYRRADVPEWARERMSGFDALAEGLAFELHCQKRVQLRKPEIEPAIGQALHFDLVIPPMPEGPVGLGGENDHEPTSFGIWLQIEDRFVDGSSHGHTSRQTLRFPAAVEVHAGQSVTLPVELQLPASAAVQRRIDLHVYLLPGYVQRAGMLAPVRHTVIATAHLTQYPAGFEPIKEQPLDTLRTAMQLGDQEHFAHVYLAALFAPKAEREQVLELLVRWVRLGRADQARVAMAALRELTGIEVAVGDRDGWLAWWLRRR